MRVLFVTLPARTHLFNLVPLAWAMHAAGHHVCVASTPDILDEVERTGLTAVSVGEKLHLTLKTQREFRSPAVGNRSAGQRAEVVRRTWTDIAESRPEKLTWDFVQPLMSYTSFICSEINTDPVIDDLVHFAQRWQPDLILWDPLTFAGPVAARATGAAHGRMLFGLDVIARVRRIFLNFVEHPMADLGADPFAHWLACALERYGCEFDEEIMVGQWTIDPMPAWMRFPLDLPYVPVRYVPYNGPFRLPDWALEPPTRPRICLTLGLSRRELERETVAYLSAVLSALADIDADFIATLNSLQLDTAGVAVPDNVRTVDFVPLSAILPTCAAIIHHGGSGTFGNAMVHGVPQLVIPDDTWDTPHIGNHVARRGMGLSLPSAETSPERLVANVRRLLDEPSFRRCAMEVREEALSVDGPSALVTTLERLTETSVTR